MSWLLLFLYILASPLINFNRFIPVKDNHILHPLVEERFDHVEEDPEEPGLVDDVDPPDPDGEASVEECDDGPDLVQAEAAEVSPPEAAGVIDDCESRHLGPHLDNSTIRAVNEPSRSLNFDV